MPGAHWQALDGERRARVVVERRPLEAGTGLPSDVAAVASAPGREAYPGDVFDLHSRLLERAASSATPRRRHTHGSADHRDESRRRFRGHPTKVTSITDGQVDLFDNLFNARRAPAVDVGIRRLCRWRGAGEVDEGVAGTSKSSRVIPRARGVRDVRVRARRDLQGPARARPSPGRNRQAAAEQPDACGEAGRRGVRRTKGHSTVFPSRTYVASRPSCSTTRGARTARCWRHCAATQRPTRRGSH